MILDEDTQSEHSASGSTHDGQEQTPLLRPTTTGAALGPSLDPIPTKSRKNGGSQDKLEAAFQILKTSAAHNQKDDSESDPFGKLIAKKLDSYSKVTKIAVQQAVMGIIFNADSGFYEQPQHPHPRPVNLHPSTSQYKYHPYPTPNIIHHPVQPQSYSSAATISSQDPSYSQNQHSHYQQSQHPISPQEYHNNSSSSLCSPPECSPTNPSSEETTYEELVKAAMCD
ncbi:unnamed protein product [Acanthoscelides obtectus]|uniref:Uncharacterized protein n=1 Tax=Acanthoscelides obtectus TaxID=200917 RepID=A0A9P0KGL2_ACAOB|nr:unnamed protein product [Acanthoscelides obtectus]CAK1674862.1 hypothetical protein AOBTE_LOCUS29782 [Acanthoscelides obtectus]